MFRLLKILCSCFLLIIKNRAGKWYIRFTKETADELLNNAEDFVLKVEVVIKNGWQTKKVRELIHEEAGVKYSFRHTIRIIQSWVLTKIVPRPRYAFSKKEFDMKDV